MGDKGEKMGRTVRQKTDSEVFAEKCYHAYQLHWMLQHGYSLNDLFEAQCNNLSELYDPEDDLDTMMENARDDIIFNTGIKGGEIFACEEEFYETEYLNEDYMSILLRIVDPGTANENLNLWKRYTGCKAA